MGSKKVIGVCDAKAVSDSERLIGEIDNRRDMINGLIGVYSALRDEKRLKMLVLMLNGQICVNDLAYVMRIPQPTVSRDLLILENAKLLEKKRDGRWIYYKVRESPLTNAFKDVVKNYLGIQIVNSRA